MTKIQIQNKKTYKIIQVNKINKLIKFATNMCSKIIIKTNQTKQCIICDAKNFICIGHEIVRFEFFMFCHRASVILWTPAATLY